MTLQSHLTTDHGRGWVRPGQGQTWHLQHVTDCASHPMRTVLQCRRLLNLPPMHMCPPHQAVESGLWEKAVTDLPDANTWPTWGALRERVLTACTVVRARPMQQPLV